MENSVIRELFFGCVISAIFFIPVSLLAYDDTDPLRAHSPINKAAIEYFEKSLMPNDKYLKSSAASLDGQAVFGYGWDRMEDGGPARATIAPRVRPDLRKTKRIRAWIINGGFSADEPEGPTALVHFYDPMAPEGSRYLTDQLFVSRMLKRLSSLNTNPNLDARQWGVSDVSKDTEIYEENFIQEYSYDDAKANLTKALESTDRTNENYGKAWRGVGETMHMVADMTVPAHVRNDGHATLLRDADPYENSTNETHVNEYAFNTPAELNYKTGIMTLMDTVARFTNNNFFSKDTIPGQPGSLTKYSLPDISKMTPDKDGYLIDSEGRYAAAPNTWQQKVFNNPGRYSTQNIRVLTSQRSILIPTAVRACAAVLDRFLPRFIVNQTVSPEDPANPNAGKYVMHGSIKRAGDAWNNLEWQNKLAVNNGATIVLTSSDGQVTNIRIDPTKLLNGMTEFSYTFDAKPSDKVELVYDLGGYVVRGVDARGIRACVAGGSIKPSTEPVTILDCSKDDGLNLVYSWNTKSGTANDGTGSSGTAAWPGREYSTGTGVVGVSGCTQTINYVSACPTTALVGICRHSFTSTSYGVSVDSDSATYYYSPAYTAATAKSACMATAGEGRGVTTTATWYTTP